MAPQFVDFNADGQLDIVTATFDGSPHVSLKTDKGFAEPQRLLDKDGKRIMLAQFWNYPDNKWDENSSQPKGHCTSAVAFDWDNDGDHDLILGSYGDGNLYRQMNEGTANEAKFTGKNTPVLSGGKPFALDGGVTTPRLIDWNGDGLTDLLCGSYGDSYGMGAGGGVYVYLNKGQKGNPEFGSAVTLITASTKGGTEATRPDIGLFPDAVDYDGDGDLDLIVGGYSIYTPPRRELSDKEEARIKELDAEMATLNKELQELTEEAMKESAAANAQEQEKAYSELRKSERYKELNNRLRNYYEELGVLRPNPERKPFVWFYRRAGVSAAL